MTYKEWAEKNGFGYLEGKDIEGDEEIRMYAEEFKNYMFFELVLTFRADGDLEIYATEFSGDATTLTRSLLEELFNLTLR